MAARMVGATSPRTPSASEVPFRPHPSGALAMMKGTLLNNEVSLGCRSGERAGRKAVLLVGGVASLGLAVGELHLLSIAVVGSNVKDVARLLAAFVDLGNGLVASLDGDESGVILFQDEVLA